MRLEFIDVKFKKQIILPKEYLEQLPKKVMLFLNIQFHDQYESIKKQLESCGIIVHTTRPKHAWHDGQILGCSVEDWSAVDAEGFVYIGDGLFHPKALLFKNDRPVFIFDPKTEKTRVLTREDITAIVRSRQGAKATFLVSKQVGVLITTKYGQSRLEPAIKLQEKFPDKTFHFLLADVIDFSKLEDFPFIEVFVNTACPRVMDDFEKVPRPMVNLDELGIVW